MEQSGNIPIFNIPGTLFGNILRNFMGNFFRIFWEYIMGMFHEYSSNMCLPGVKRTSTLKLFFSEQLIIFSKKSIIDGRLGFKEASENNVIYKAKPRWR